VSGYQKRSLPWWPALLILLPGSATALGGADVPAIAFATGDGSTVNVGEYQIPKSSTSESVYLFIEFGSAASTNPGGSCVTDAIGEELCGFDVTVTVENDLFIVDFIPASNVEFSPATFNSTSRSLHAVGLTANNPGPGPQPIGELVVNTDVPVGGKVLVTSVAAQANLIKSLLAADQEVATTDEVPEPDSILVLIAGTLTIIALHSRRLRRHSTSPVHAGH
jgi:hypothetical protein